MVESAFFRYDASLVARKVVESAFFRSEFFSVVESAFFRYMLSLLVLKVVVSEDVGHCANADKGRTRRIVIVSKIFFMSVCLYRTMRTKRIFPLTFGVHAPVAVSLPHIPLLVEEGGGILKGIG